MDAPFRVGRIWYLRYPGTLHFQPFLSRQSARDARAAFLRGKQAQTTAKLRERLV